MTYDFEEILNRRTNFSSKWDVKENELPMSIADMDFRSSPNIVGAITRIAQEGIYGYTDVSDEWKQSIINWWKDKHGFTMEKEWILFSTGVVPSISSMVRALSKPGDNVICLTPVYDIFFHSIENNGRKVLESPLIYDGGRYQIDFKDLEKKLKTPSTPLLILCNPANPAGRVWTKKELVKIGALCAKYGVLVLSDEIHCDLARPRNPYIPFASVNETNLNNSITFLSPTKTFNLAGIQTSAIVVPSNKLYPLVYRAINNDEIAEPNVFSQAATIAAYNQSEPWLKQLINYLESVREGICRFISAHLPEINITESEATYLLWLDCTRITSDSEKLAAFIRKDTGLILTDGKRYRGNGKYFLRMNYACPSSTIQDGLNRLYKGIKDYEAKTSKGKSI